MTLIDWKIGARRNVGIMNIIWGKTKLVYECYECKILSVNLYKRLGSFGINIKSNFPVLGWKDVKWLWKNSLNKLKKVEISISMHYILCWTWIPFRCVSSVRKADTWMRFKLCNSVSFEVRNVPGNVSNSDCLRIYVMYGVSRALISRIHHPWRDR